MDKLSQTKFIVINNVLRYLKAVQHMSYFSNPLKREMNITLTQRQTKYKKETYKTKAVQDNHKAPRQHQISQQQCSLKTKNYTSVRKDFLNLSAEHPAKSVTKGALQLIKNHVQWVVLIKQDASEFPIHSFLHDHLY